MAVTRNLCIFRGGAHHYEESVVGADKHVISKFSLRISQGKNKDAFFVNVEAWNLSDNLRAALNRDVGNNLDVSVQGEMREDSWTDKTTNTKRTKMKLVADVVTYIGKFEKREQAAPVQAAPVQAQPVVAVVDEDNPF